MTHDSDLVALLTAQIHRHHVATAACPLPPVEAPLTWIIAANGTFVRGANRVAEVIVRVDSHRSPSPGLAEIRPSIRWLNHGPRMPGRLLQRVLGHARQATDQHRRPVEQQYWITRINDRLTVIRPPQLATSVMVMTPRLDLPILVDIHSHHHMSARFSMTDDHDDRLAIGVSVVIGTIFLKPTIRTRLTVYGHTQDVPSTLIFDNIAPFEDTYAGGTDGLH